MPKATLWSAYLRALEQAGEKSRAEIRGALGVSVRQLAAWRCKVAGFVRLELDATNRGRGLAAPTEEEYREAEEAVAAPATDHQPPLEVFLEKFRASDDRIKACRAAKIEWADVLAAQKTDPKFAAAYQRLMDERNIRHEDAINARGKGGDTAAAKAYLQVNDPRYSKSAAPNGEDEDDDVEAALRTFLRISARPVPAAAPKVLPGDLAALDPEAAADA